MGWDLVSFKMKNSEAYFNAKTRKSECLLPAYGIISFGVLQGVSPCHVDLASKEWKFWDTAIFLIRNDATIKEDVERFINKKCSLIEKGSLQWHIYGEGNSLLL